MDFQMEKEAFPTISHQSIMLANQAWMEQLKNGYVSVKCPKCHEHPEIMTTPRGERTNIRCKCGYFLDGWINL